MASRLSGVPLEVFYIRLQSIGFDISQSQPDSAPHPSGSSPSVSGYRGDCIVLDVREALASGKDPLTSILDKVKALSPGDALKVINTFEPVPLIKMLEKQGFTASVECISPELVETVFHKKTEPDQVDLAPKKAVDAGWDEVLLRFGENRIEIDVRDLDMPLPMHTILAELEKLPENKALFVYHKRIPVFLLPELTAQNFDYRIKEVSDGQVRLLIFKA